MNRNPPRSGVLPLAAFLLSLVIAPSAANAGCRNNKPVCGNANICHSDQRGANKHDLDQPLHSTICTVLNDMEKTFGKLEILAAFRRDNAARGGARNSMHLKVPGGPSMAVDVFRPASRKSMYQFLGSEKCKGIRYNIYCATGTVHFDVSHLPDNYSGCRDFFRTRCGGGVTPSQGTGDGYHSPAVDRYKERTRTAASSGTPKCWNSQKWGACCGPVRKRNGYCTG